jgi:predicted alpha/beta-fold hydrolase
MSAFGNIAVRDFAPPPGLRHAHMQSLLSGWPLRGRYLRKAANNLLNAARGQILDCGDGVRLLGYHSPQPAPSKGLAIFLHGWEGCVDSNYVLSLSAKLYAHGFDIFRLNFRDHGGSESLNEELFHSCRIAEVVNAIAAVQRQYPAPRTVLIGHSLGGNFALRAAARAQDADLRLDKVLAVCPVLDPRSTMQALEQGLWVYRHYFLRRWRRSLTAKAACFPERYDFGDLTRFKTLTETTRFFVETYTDFPDLDAYLRGYAITGLVLAKLEVPTRLIAAADDPVIPSRDLERLARPRAMDLQVVSYGGHCGFLDSYALRSWLDSEILALLSAA